MKAIKKDIVYVHCLGFGSDGPYAERPAFDDLIQGLSGMTSLMPRVDGNEQPRFVPMTVADKVSGLHAVYATLAALRQRDKTGEAVCVEVPMFECTTHFLLEDVFDEATFDPPTGPFGFKHYLDASLQPFKTQDGWIVIAPYTDGRWVKTFEAMGAADELEDERLADRKARYYNSEYKHDRVRALLSKQTTAHWIEIFKKADVPAAPVNQLEELHDDPHLKVTNFFQRREHPTEGGYWETQPPVHFRDMPKKEIQPAPHIGEHTNEILDELGLEAPPPPADEKS